MAVDSRQNLFISGLVAVAVSGVVSLTTLSLAEGEHMMDSGGSYTPPPSGSESQSYTPPSGGTTYDSHPVDSGSQPTTNYQPSGGTTNYQPSGGSTPSGTSNYYPSGDHSYGGTPSGSPSGTPGGTSSPWPTSGGMGGQGEYQGVGVGGGQRYQGSGGPFGGEGHEGAPYGPGMGGETSGSESEMRSRFMKQGEEMQNRMMKDGEEMGRKMIGEEMRKRFGEFGSAGGMPGGMGGQHGSFSMPFSFPGMSSNKNAASQVDRILKNLPTTEEGTGLTADQEAKIDSAVTKADAAIDKAEATLEKLFTGTKAPTANKVLKQLNALVTHFNTAMQLQAFSDGASDLADHVSELITDTCSAADETVKNWGKKGAIMCEKFFDYLESSEGL